MFRFLQRRPARAVVFAEGKDQKFRWRVVAVPSAIASDAVIDANATRTVFVDAVGDAYHGIKPCFKDAMREITEWCLPTKIGWYVEKDGKLHQCQLTGETLIFGETLTAQ